MAYKRLDLSSLNFSETPISYNDAVNSVKPLVLPENVIEGKQEITIKSVTPMSDNKIGATLEYV